MQRIFVNVVTEVPNFNIKIQIVINERDSGTLPGMTFKYMKQLVNCILRIPVTPVRSPVLGTKTTLITYSLKE